MSNILITSAGRRVELVEAFKNSLKSTFSYGKVYTTDLNPKLSAACHVADGFFKVGRVTELNYIDSLLEICLNHEIKLVVPTIDTELLVLAENKKRFKEKGIELVISDESLVKACRDKRETAKLYEDIGIPSPKIYPLDKIEYPAFCKPYDGSSSIGAFPILNEKMLTEEIKKNPKNIYMELVGKEFVEYTVDAYFDKNGVMRCLVPRERIEVRGGEVSKGCTRKNFVYDYLKSRLSRLRGARGCITAQIFVNLTTESIKALEINPRFGGGYPLSHAAGADYTSWLIKEYICNDSIPFFEDWEDRLLMLRYDAKVLLRG